MSQANYVRCPWTFDPNSERYWLKANGFLLIILAIVLYDIAHALNI